MLLSDVLGHDCALKFEVRQGEVFPSVLIINLVCTDEKSENGRAKNSISTIKDKPEHLNQVQNLTGVCVS